MHFIKLPLLLLLVCSLGLSQAGLTHRRLRETVPAGVPANTVIISEPASDLRKDQIPVTIIQEAAPETPAIVPQKDEPEQKLRTEAEKSNEIASEPVVVATEVKDEKPITELRAADVEPVVVPDENDDAPEVYTEILFVDGDAPSDDLSVRQGTPATPASTTQGNFVQQLIQNSPIGQFFNQLTGQQQQQQQQQDAQVSADEPAATPAPTIPGFLNPQAAITSAQQAVQNAAQFVGNTTTQAFQGLQQFATNLGTQFQNTLSNFGGNQQGTSDSTTPRPPGPIQSVINNFIGGNNNNQSAAPVAGQGTNPLQGIISFFQGGNRPAQAAAATPAISEAPAATEPEKPSRLDDKIEESQEISEQQQAELDATNEVRNSQEVVGGGSDDSFEEIKPEEVIVVNDDASEQRV